MNGRESPVGERGVSEVISTLLMVAVAIVLAAMVGSVMLDVLGDVDDDPIAGASVDFDDEDDRIRVVYTATQKEGTTLAVKVFEGGTDSDISGSPKTIAEVGESRTFDATDGLVDGSGYTVRVVAKAPDGKRAVISEESGSV